MSETVVTVMDLPSSSSTVTATVTVDSSATESPATVADLPSSSSTVTATVDSSPATDLPNASERVDITADDLPLHCPMPGKRLWDSHPRVFLPIKPDGEEVCPYCGTRYVFAAADSAATSPAESPTESN